MKWDHYHIYIYDLTHLFIMMDNIGFWLLPVTYMPLSLWHIPNKFMMPPSFHGCKITGVQLWWYHCFRCYCCCYTPTSMKLKGGYTGFTLSVCPSVDRIVSALYLHVNNTCQIHFIFAHLIKQLEMVCFKILKKWNFGEFFKFVTLTLSSFDLGSNMTQ